MQISKHIKSIKRTPTLYELYLEDQNRTLHDRISSLEHQLRRSQTELLTDSLTNVGNRRRFDESFKYELMHLVRSRGKEYLSIVLIDLDNFKQINDLQGHNSGDKILIKAGNILKSTFSRDIDTVCRYGGDEFTIILPKTDNNGARIVVDMARRNAEKSDISMSFGISSTNSLEIPKPKHDLDEIIRCMVAEADARMYEDKLSKKGSLLRN